MTRWRYEVRDARDDAGEDVETIYADTPETAALAFVAGRFDTHCPDRVRVDCENGYRVTCDVLELLTPGGEVLA